MEERTVDVNGKMIGGDSPLVLVSGPCVIEGEEITFNIARRLKEIASTIDVPLIFKASFDKANRTSLSSFRGPGIQEGLRILRQVSRELALPVLTDVHCVQEVDSVSQVADVIQIPAFLCRQTDLLIAVGRTGKAVNIKKGQFLAPRDIRFAIEKVTSTGNERVMVTERGTTFGYNNLVVDMRSLPILRGLGYPVVFDATHSVQLPGGQGGASGGQREFIPFLARAAAATGIHGLFMEVHPEPDQARSDGPNSFPLDRVGELLSVLKRIDSIAKQTGDKSFADKVQ